MGVATAEEDLSYALYVLEYSSGNFQSARDHICKSIDILRSLLPKDHLLQSSARRVKALILEEIALDNVSVDDESTGWFHSPTFIQTVDFRVSRYCGSIDLPSLNFRISKSLG